VPESEVLATALAIASFTSTILAVIVTAKALAFPLEAGELESGILARCEASLPVIVLAGLEITHLFGQITLFLILEASDKGNI
jgi:hypothetical protein